MRWQRGWSHSEPSVSRWSAVWGRSSKVGLHRRPGNTSSPRKAMRWRAPCSWLGRKPLPSPWRRSMGMAEELREAPAAVRRQEEALTGPLRELVMRLKSSPPQLVVTCARGSSAHAATFAKHLIELHLGIPVAAMAPNISTVYRRPLRLEGHLFLAISQSGRGPTLAIAREAALKLKEIANRHAEPFSGAEFLHGPVALVEPRYPILMFVPDDAAAAGLERLADDLAGKGAALFIAGAGRDRTAGPPWLPG